MSDLYTSLVRAKQELNGGVLPAMTPIPEKLHAIFDPEFTIGMGALREDPEKGLQCPVRGCGGWYQSLGKHANIVHRAVGGSDGIKRALSIPRGAQLISKAHAERLGANMRRRIAAGETPHLAAVRARSPASRPHYIRGKGTSEKRTVGYRNLLNSCDAQLAQRLLSVRDKIGRDPSAREVEHLDPPLVPSGIRLYGTWNAFMAAVGLKTVAQGKQRRTITKAAVLELLWEWYRQNGHLPTSCDGNRARQQTPPLPKTCTILRALETDSWAQAMERAAVALNIRGGRYGLSERPARSEAAD